MGGFTGVAGERGAGLGAAPMGSASAVSTAASAAIQPEPATVPFGARTSSLYQVALFTTFASATRTGVADVRS